MQTSTTIPPSDAPLIQGETFDYFQLSWFERLRVLFGRPIKVKLRVSFLKDPKVFKHDLTLECKPIGGNFS